MLRPEREREDKERKSIFYFRPLSIQSLSFFVPDQALDLTLAVLCTVYSALYTVHQTLCYRLSVIASQTGRQAGGGPQTQLISPQKHKPVTNFPTLPLEVRNMTEPAMVESYLAVMISSFVFLSSPKYKIHKYVVPPGGAGTA